MPIITHNGNFHCDEALAVFMLRQLSQFAALEIVRTRDPAVIETGDIVVDVGGVYDAARNRFDHHQRGFTETFDSEHETKLSSAGLVYKHFGKEIIQTLTGLSGEVVDILHLKIYDKFIEELDGVDNGISQYEGTQRYSVNSTLSQRVARLNPAWNDTDQSEKFSLAMELTGKEFVDAVNFYAKSWLPARQIVEESMRDSTLDPAGQVVLLKVQCPWKDHLFELEKVMGTVGSVKYVIFGSDSDWRIQCVPAHAESFQNRLSLPEPWQGLRDDALSSKSGIDGCIFVHANGFIGGNKTCDGAIAMAKKALTF